ncbi:MAG: hypothetical protein DRQ39_04110 [Gammaproteobacteria bacterium]|nr:MAG: hypothetical protein DRQ39_04110 [Gammaproteobacteria bacterium]
MVAQVLWLDFETFSECDLRSKGADIYCRDPLTEVLMLGWAIDNGPEQLWDLTKQEQIPHELRLALYDTSVTKRAFNAPFELGVFNQVLKIPQDINQWQDAAVMARALCFAGSLDTILGAIGLENKSADGKGLIKIFSIPQRPTKKNPYTRRNIFTDPDLWADFCRYCRVDITVMRNLWAWCAQYEPVSEDEWRLWRLDYTINQRGVPIDLPLVDAALAAMARQKVSVRAAMEAITGPDKITPGPLKDWLGLDDFKKATKEKALETATGKRKLMLTLSLQLAQLSSASKWTAMGLRTDKASGVLRETLMFSGAARTGRWAGRGLQIHNMKWSSDTQESDIAEIMLGLDVSMDKISKAVRGAICAPPGKTLVVSDLSGIESRLAGWVCRCPRINALFAGGKDVYKDLATYLYSVPYEEVTKEQRGRAKPAALGCQYRLGGKGLQAYAEGFGVDMDLREAKHHVGTYRSLYPEVVKFWGWVDKSLKEVYRNRGLTIAGYSVAIYQQGEFMCIRIPSGRVLRYHRAHYENRYIPGYKDMGKVPQFCFGGLENFHWHRDQNAHSGGILENIIQAVARDVLAVWITRANAAGLTIIGHVHDEIICLEDDANAEQALLTLNRIAAQPIEWAPGLLLSAEGYKAKRYKKD